MTRHFKIVMVLIAWFMATGAQWDVVQTFGWARMIVNYSRAMPLIEAVKETFDGRMCRVCKAVNDAKQQETNAEIPGGKFASKILLVFQPVPAVILNLPDLESWSQSHHEGRSAQRTAPPIPPPRLA